MSYCVCVTPVISRNSSPLVGFFSTAALNPNRTIIARHTFAIDASLIGSTGTVAFAAMSEVGLWVNANTTTCELSCGTRLYTLSAGTDGVIDAFFIACTTVVVVVLKITTNPTAFTPTQLAEEFAFARDTKFTEFAGCSTRATMFGIIASVNTATIAVR